MISLLGSHLRCCRHKKTNHRQYCERFLAKFVKPPKTVSTRGVKVYHYQRDSVLFLGLQVCWLSTKMYCQYCTHTHRDPDSLVFVIITFTPGTYMAHIVLTIDSNLVSRVFLWWYRSLTCLFVSLTQLHVCFRLKQPLEPLSYNVLYKSTVTSCTIVCYWESCWGSLYR